MDFIEHKHLKGIFMFRTSCFVGDVVIGLPTKAGRIVMFNARSRQLDFIEHEHLKGRRLFLTSCVVGDDVVDLPFNAVVQPLVSIPISWIDCYASACMLVRWIECFLSDTCCQMASKWLPNGFQMASAHA